MTAEVVDFCAVYFATLLGRCAACSLLTLALALLLRKALWKRSPFAKGVAWSAVPVALCLGKLRVYYESRVFWPFILWQNWCGGCWPVRYGYLLGIALSVTALCRRRAKLRRTLRGLPSTELYGQRTLLCDAPVSPFATGLLSPKIVLPKIARERLDERDLQAVVLHERTHIRLGHLWIFLLWDVISALLWPNPFLRLCAGQLREDMEHICDAVTIRHSGRDAVSYGRAVLNALTLFRDGPKASPASFAGGTAFREAKERLRRIRDCRPYSRRAVAILCACTLVALCAVRTALQTLSLPRYTELTGFTVLQVNRDAEFVTLYQTDVNDGLPLVWSGNRAEIDGQALRVLLPPDAPDDSLYGVLWGGFLKLPGIGGGLNAVYIDGPPDDGVVPAEFCNVDDLFYVRLIKWI